ncbi:matrix metalloproteinase-16-like [Limulus polyphemus]|uniref:Matrix metalloproteinase-16-like n=1 Tax=Limulus polyphemus TaxID=6850 RepID=A0ABM1T6Z3_LIMPO|nr:matrix metalloproteinase-16-like [Limulus polyphemus]
MGFNVCLNIALAVIGISILASTVIAAPLADSSQQALMYLKKFGYVDETSDKSSSLTDFNSLENSIKDFQRFAGLSETGVLDNDTITMMNMPRCGVKDIVGHSISARKKRYALQGSKWRTTSLTYKIGKYPSRIKDHLKVDKEIEKAFKIWSDVTSINFIHKKNGRVHIDIRFEEGEHGDGDPFDGPGKTLAHAFFPQFGGDAHFDDEEKWSINSYYGTNLFQVAAHEFGHSLGLSHSDVKKALMAPFYRGYDPNYKLDEDDILAIQVLYGTRSNDRKDGVNGVDKQDHTPSSHPDTGDAPDLCQDSSIDAVTKTENGQTYVFKDDFYKLFQGGKYWRFRNKKMDSGYPKDISVGFEGIPDNVDAALVWSGNGKTYFFKGKQYWRFDSRSDPPVSDRYPRPISNWEGIPNNIDGVFKWQNNRTYFFKGNNYYRFNDRTFTVDSGNPSYPRSTSVWWFDCKASSTSGTRPFRGKDEVRNIDPKHTTEEPESKSSPNMGMVNNFEDMDVVIYQPSDGNENDHEDKPLQSAQERNSSSARSPFFALMVFIQLVRFILTVEYK